MKTMKMVCGKNHSKLITIQNHMVNRSIRVSFDTQYLHILGPSSIGIDVNFLNFDNVYGIPEHADAFSLRSTQ